MKQKKIWRISEKKKSRLFHGRAYYKIEIPLDDRYKINSRIIEDHEDWGFSRADAERFIESFHALQNFDIKDIKSGRLQVILKEAGFETAKESAQ